MIKEILYVIHENDLVDFLKKEGLLDRLRDAKCVICNGDIDLDNLGGIYFEKGEIKFVCDSLTCLSELSKRSEKGC